MDQHAILKNCQENKLVSCLQEKIYVIKELFIVNADIVVTCNKHGSVWLYAYHHRHF